MTTECNPAYLDFPMLGSRHVLADSTAATSPPTVARCYSGRPSDSPESSGSSPPVSPTTATPTSPNTTVEELVAQRVYALGGGGAGGTEDVNDPTTSAATRCSPPSSARPTPRARPAQRPRDRGKPLGRQEHAEPPRTVPPRGPTRTPDTRRSVPHPRRQNASRGAVSSRPTPGRPSGSSWTSRPPTTRYHGHQLGRFFHGYYKNFCYLPLYNLLRRPPPLRPLRALGHRRSAGSLTHLKRIVAQVRKAWPGVKIVVRADSGFCRDEIMTWCEAERRGLRTRAGARTRGEGDDRRGTGRGSCGVRADEGTDPGVHGSPIPDAGQLEP